MVGPRDARVVALLAMAVLTVGAPLLAPPARAAAQTFVVTSTAGPGESA